MHILPSAGDAADFYPHASRYVKPPRDPKFLSFLRQQPCACCGTRGRVEAAHTGKHGLGSKASDYQAIPLCERCHRTDKLSYHALGERIWSEARAVDLDRLRIRFQCAFLESLPLLSSERKVAAAWLTVHCRITGLFLEREPAARSLSLEYAKKVNKRRKRKLSRK